MRSVARQTAGQRELAIREALLEGNVPSFQRNLRTIAVRAEDGATKLAAWIGVMVDYLAIGDDDDFVRIPVAARTAQLVADAAGCILPTRRIVDEVYRQADVHLTSPRLPDTSKIASCDYYVAHHEAIEIQRRKQSQAKLGSLMAGHKKDIVISRRLAEADGQLAIYGWFLDDDKPIQPLSTVHSVQYVDYSHGVRLVHQTIQIEGNPMSIQSALRDETLSRLVSDEGTLTIFGYH